MTSRQSIFSHVRLSSIMMGLGAVLTGTACAALRGNTEYVPATLCALFVIFIQISGNFMYRRFDLINFPMIYKGPAGEKNAKSRKELFLKEGGRAALLLSALCGLAIASIGGWWTIVVGLFILGMWRITMCGVTPLLRTPFGIICPFILFGPVCVISTSMIQALYEMKASLNWYDITPSLYMSIVIGLMCVNSTMLYSYSNYYRDKKIGRETFVVKVGMTNARKLFAFNSVAYTVISVVMCLHLHLRSNGLDMMPAAVCFCVGVYTWWKMRTLSRGQLKSLVDLGNFNVLLMGLLSFLIFELTGAPADSTITFFGI